MTHPLLPAALIEDLVELLAQALVADLEAYPHLDDLPLPEPASAPRKSPKSSARKRLSTGRPSPPGARHERDGELDEHQRQDRIDSDVGSRFGGAGMLDSRR